MKITLDAALRARDVSRPTAEQEAQAELNLADLPDKPRPRAEPQPGPDQPGAAARGRRPGRRPGRRIGRAGPSLAERSPGTAVHERGQDERGQDERGQDERGQDERGQDERGQEARAPGPRDAGQPEAPTESRRARPRVRRRYRSGQRPDQGSGGSSPVLS
jgi:hypothetical protein